MPIQMIPMTQFQHIENTQKMNYTIELTIIAVILLGTNIISIAQVSEYEKEIVILYRKDKYKDKKIQELEFENSILSEQKEKELLFEDIDTDINGIH